MGCQHSKLSVNEFWVAESHLYKAKKHLAEKNSAKALACLDKAIVSFEIVIKKDSTSSVRDLLIKAYLMQGGIYEKEMDKDHAYIAYLAAAKLENVVAIRKVKALEKFKPKEKEKGIRSDKISESALCNPRPMLILANMRSQTEISSVAVERNAFGCKNK